MTGSSPPFAAVPLFLLVAAAAPLLVLATASGGATFGLDFHHRFSDRVHSWVGPAAWGTGGHPPERGTAEYYAALVEHDRALLGGRRRLASAQGPLTFADGNRTLSLNNLSFLYYSFVSIGTPNVTFLAALDTGSDLFWVPCDCQLCASTTGGDFGFRQPRFFNTFSSNSSSTSKKVPCSSDLCDLQSTCSASSDTCPYRVKYLTENTTTSGYLLEDILYLTSDDTRDSPLQTRVTIGCGQVQTGSFLVAGGFNGVIGLGLSKISVPSTLAGSGLTSNSFSMCFGRDDIVGRIVFGDRGGADQQTTPIINTEQVLTGPSYLVSVMQLQLNNNTLSRSFKAYFDTGTSMTSLTDPAYTAVAEAFDALVPYQRVNLPQSQQQQLFEYCYIVNSPNQTFVAPTINLVMNGGGKYPVLRPVAQLILSTNRGDFNLYCLGLLKDAQINIIGQNFMSGLKVVFDREKLVLGWKEFNCYDKEKPLPTDPRNTTSPSLVQDPNGTPSGVHQQSGGASGHSVHMPNFYSHITIWSLVLGHLIQFLFPVF